MKDGSSTEEEATMDCRLKGTNPEEDECDWLVCKHIRGAAGRVESGFQDEMMYRL